MNWLDIVVIAILVINLLSGWFRGLIKSVVNVVSIVLGFICAKMYHMTMYTMLEDRFGLVHKVKEGVLETFKNVELPSVADAATLPTNELTSNLPDSELLSSLVESFIKSDTFNQTMQSSVESFSDAFSTWLADKLVTIISMVVVFLIVYIGIRIIGYILNQLFQLPVLKGVNKLSGLVFGLAKGTFFSMLLVLIIVILSPVFSQWQLVETLETSDVAIYFYKYNIVMMIFEGLI